MISDREFIDAAAKGVPVCAEPFNFLAAKLALPEAEVIARLRDLIAAGKVRRFAASVRHQPLGYAFNVMALARSDQDHVEPVGKAGALLPAVSHCYQRPHPDGDPFCVYLMIHGREEETIAKTIAEIKALPGVRGIEVCPSIRELKKTSLSGVSSELFEN